MSEEQINMMLNLKRENATLRRHIKFERYLFVGITAAMLLVIFFLVRENNLLMERINEVAQMIIG